MEERIDRDRGTDHRTVRLTQDGESHYRRCVRLLADVEEAEGSFRNAAPKGQLRVNLQGTLARHFVVPALPGFLARYPELALHIGEDDRLVDLVRGRRLRAARGHAARLVDGRSARGAAAAGHGREPGLFGAAR